MPTPTRTGGSAASDSPPSRRACWPRGSPTVRVLPPARPTPAARRRRRRCSRRSTLRSPWSGRRCQTGRRRDRTGAAAAPDRHRGRRGRVPAPSPCPRRPATHRPQRPTWPVPWCRCAATGNARRTAPTPTRPPSRHRPARRCSPRPPAGCRHRAPARHCPRAGRTRPPGAAGPDPRARRLPRRRAAGPPHAPYPPASPWPLTGSAAPAETRPMLRVSRGSSAAPPRPSRRSNLKSGPWPGSGQGPVLSRITLDLGSSPYCGRWGDPQPWPGQHLRYQRPDSPARPGLPCAS